MLSIVSHQSCQTYNRYPPPPLKNIMIIVSGPITIRSEDIQRIAKGVKSLLSAELSSMNNDIQNIVKSEVQIATRPLQEKHKFLEQQNTDLFLKIDELINNIAVDPWFVSQVYPKRQTKIQQTKFWMLYPHLSPA